MGRMGTPTWTPNRKSVSDEQIEIVQSLKPGEEYIFSVEDFGDRNPNDFRILLINYMKKVKHTKIATSVINGEVHVQLVNTELQRKEEKAPIVEIPKEPEKTFTDKDGDMCDKNGNKIYATPAELEEKRIKDELRMKGE